VSPPGDAAAEQAPATRRINRKSLLALGALLFAVSTLQTWWANRSDDRLGEAVAALAQPGDIRMISSESCAICQLARQWLLQHRVPFSECLIERDAACRADFVATGAPGTPVFQVRGEQMLGFRAAALRDLLERDERRGPP
jgi:hypothetical protein